METSNEMLMRASQVPGKTLFNLSSSDRNRFWTFLCVIITPLGRPVDPDV